MGSNDSWGPVAPAVRRPEVEGPFDIPPAREPSEQAARDAVFPGGAKDRLAFPKRDVDHGPHK